MQTRSTDRENRFNLLPLPGTTNIIANDLLCFKPVLNQCNITAVKSSFVFIVSEIKAYSVLLTKISSGRE